LKRKSDFIYTIIFIILVLLFIVKNITGIISSMRIEYFALAILEVVLLGVSIFCITRERKGK
jgi:hypothetical protein